MKMLLKLVKTKWSNTTKSVVFISSFLSPRNNSTSASGQRISLAYDLNDKFSSRRALVISHGLFASKATWRAMARRVNEATRQRIYTVDMRNHGNSMPYVDNMNYFEMAGDLEKFINEIVVGRDKCEHVSLMGHSMGGKASMTLVLSDASYIFDKGLFGVDFHLLYFWILFFIYLGLGLKFSFSNCSHHKMPN